MTLESDLISACINGNLDEVQNLVKQGVDIHVVDDLPLRNAALHGHLEVVKYLVDQGVNIDINNDFPLRYAAYYGHLGMVIYLRNIAGPKWKCHDCLLKSTCLELCDDFRG